MSAQVNHLMSENYSTQKEYGTIRKWQESSANMTTNGTAQTPKEAKMGVSTTRTCLLMFNSWETYWQCFPEESYAHRTDTRRSGNEEHHHFFWKVEWGLNAGRKIMFRW